MWRSQIDLTNGHTQPHAPKQTNKNTQCPLRMGICSACRKRPRQVALRKIIRVCVVATHIGDDHQRRFISRVVPCSINEEGFEQHEAKKSRNPHKTGKSGQSGRFCCCCWLKIVKGSRGAMCKGRSLINNQPTNQSVKQPPLLVGEGEENGCGGGKVVFAGINDSTQRHGVCK